MKTLHTQFMVANAELEIDEVANQQSPYIVTLTDEDGDTSSAWASRENLAFLHAALGKILATP